MLGVAYREEDAVATPAGSACAITSNDARIPTMSEQKHLGGCHCGKVRYEVAVDLDKEVMACNCSMCGRKGTLLTFVGADKFKLIQGENDLTDYLFNKEHIHHLFCSTCGVTSFCRGNSMKTGQPMIAVNSRCLDDVNLETLKIKHFDGKSL